MHVIDTHLHVWNLDRAEYPWLKNDTSILNRTWRLEEMSEERAAAGVTSAVLVQAAGNPEDTELMLEYARNNDWISGVVAWLPLMDTRLTAQLLEERFLGEKYFKGVRHQIHDEQDAAWLLQPAVLASLQLLAEHNIPYDLVGVLPAHIETALQVAQKVPRLRMVFDHLNQPPIATKERFGRWGDLMKEAAKMPNFYGKLSGFGTAATEDIKPYVAFALEHFGAERCFCGGDWPVSMLAKGYADTWAQIRELVGALATPAEQELIYHANATTFYQLWKS